MTPHPLLDLKADSRTRVRNGGAPHYLHVDLQGQEVPEHVTRNVSRLHLRAHALTVESPLILLERKPPHYLHVDLQGQGVPEHVTRNVSRLHLRGHALTVESPLLERKHNALIAFYEQASS